MLLSLKMLHLIILRLEKKILCKRVPKVENGGKTPGFLVELGSFWLFTEKIGTFLHNTYFKFSTFFGVTFISCFVR